MGPSKVVIGGLLVALALVGSAAAAEKKCENPTGAAACTHDLKKDEILNVKCPEDSVFVPVNAFTGVDKKVCSTVLAAFDATCNGTDEKVLNSIVPGVSITYPDSNKKNDFKIENKNELKTDVQIYATCKPAGSNDGFIIKIKFLKGGSSDASSRATMPAVMLGALTTLVVMFRA